jgi:hypothetical protein
MLIGLPSTSSANEDEETMDCRSSSGGKRSSRESCKFFVNFPQYLVLIVVLQFKEHYEKFNRNSVAPIPTKKGLQSTSNVTRLLRELE